MIIYLQTQVYVTSIVAFTRCASCPISVSVRRLAALALALVLVPMFFLLLEPWWRVEQKCMGVAWCSCSHACNSKTKAMHSGYIANIYLI